MIQEPTKTCPKCKEVYPATTEYFHKNVSRSDGLCYQCRTCACARTKIGRLHDPAKCRKAVMNWKKHDPERMRRLNRQYNLKAKFGITLKDYEWMFLRQRGCCAICGISQHELGRNLDIDHDHETGFIRGLLCQKCNTKLGWYERLHDNIHKYLKDAAHDI